MDDHHGRENATAFVSILGEYLGVRYGIQWLAWVAAFFLWLSLVGYTRKYLMTEPRLKFVLRGALALVIGGSTYALTYQKPSTEAAQQKQEPSVQQSNQGNGNSNVNAPNNQGVITVITGGDPRAKTQLDRIEKLLKAQQDHLTPEKLLEKYPLGYVIFDISEQKTMFPYQAKGELANWKIDWSTFRYREIKSPQGDVVEFIPPNIFYADGRNVVDFYDNVAECYRKVGPLCNGGSFVSAGGVRMIGEILSISPKGTVFLFGFRRSHH